MTGAVHTLLLSLRRLGARLWRPRAERAEAPSALPAAASAVAPSALDDLIDPELEITDDQILSEDTPEPSAVDLARLRQEVLSFYRRGNLAPQSFPTLAARVLSRRNMTFDEILEVARQDVAIGTAVLRVANSAAFGGWPVDNLREAITRLGVRAVSQVASAIAARALFDPASRVEYDLFPRTFNRLFHQSMTTALSAERCARELGVADPERAFSGGLMHDVGKSIALRALAGLVLSGGWPDAPAQPLVERVLEDLHVEIGTELHRSWGLPPSLLQLCQRHHDAELPDDPELRIAHVVRVVSGMNDLRVDSTFFAPVAVQVRQSLGVLRLTRLQLTALSRQISDCALLVTRSFGQFS